MNKIGKVLCVALVLAIIITVVITYMYFAKKRVTAERVAKLAQKYVEMEEEQKPTIAVISQEEYEKNKDKYDQIDQALQEDKYLSDEDGNYLLDEEGNMIRNTNTIILDEMGY